MYLDKAIMKEETNGCRNCNKRLIKFLFDSVSNNVFHIWTDVGIVILL